MRIGNPDTQSIRITNSNGREKSFGLQIRMDEGSSGLLPYSLKYIRLTLGETEVRIS